jgi:hypothetical protein
VSEHDGARPRRRAERLLGAPVAAEEARPPRERPDAPRSVRVAAVVVAVQALAAAAAGVATLWYLATGTVSSTKNAVGIVVLAVLGALLLAACARGLWRVSVWSRGPVVVVELILGLLGYTAAFQYGAPQVGIPLLVLAAVELYLLATPEARLAFSRR